MTFMIIYLALSVGAFIGYIIGVAFGSKSAYEQGQLDARTQLLEKLKEVNNRGI